MKIRFLGVLLALTCCSAANSANYYVPFNSAPATATVEAISTAKGLAQAVGGKAARIASTGSMRPTLTESDIIVYRPATFAELKVGDVVIFEAGEKASLKCSTCVVSIFAHRITAKHERSVETKGDANQREDEHPISQADIKGLIVYAIDGQTGIVRELN